MARRRKGLPVNGVMLLDKPKGLSSNHALQRVRRLFEAQKAGHTGTLDPMATGLLPICLGEATKFSAHLLEADKMYRTRVELGVMTDTGDAEGEVLERRDVPALTEGDIEAAIARFRGEIDQVPPMYSALKHQGRKLYELAREGKEVERKARRVCIHEARLIGFDGAAFELEVSCSKGTYIRTLAEDIGAALGCGAHISALRRLRTGPFDSEAMWTLEEIEALADQPTREAKLMPVDVLVDHLPALTVDDTGHQRLSHGQPAALDATALGLENLARLYHADAFIGLGVVKGPQEVAPKRLLSTVARS
ncbi:tRNA pseudouridine(55) synthase TruB [Halomonas sp. PAMB 3264]|uniref:tRNA pseudouridine(55) synthase TruB n=1 Tax=Halomonas sp. PAMB 3264 TaxID=3075222 RepID=UPI0028A0DD98|nr:tRNA pseudouridine(55) synthase TruB [Halomonas sp. PAMB 3264]WNL42684.1 tRNA pseudouridine(55) synthase TruB [Halomonas sp. PAMB 3264]